jgi:hypothetical protein
VRPSPALLGLAAGAAILSGCTTVSPPACRAGQDPGRTVQLFFGRNIGDRLGVSEADFARFVDEELTPRFPKGLTVLDAAGQWRPDAASPIVREPSKLVILALPGSAGDEDRLDAVRQAYVRRFSQDAVLMITQPACLDF